MRKTSEINAAAGADAMNLDDFIYSENVATPSGLMSPPPAPRRDDASPGATPASGIPIKSRKGSSSNHFVPQSVPQYQRTGNNEFNYIQRHHRKTSIDERRVSACPPSCSAKFDNLSLSLPWSGSLSLTCCKCSLFLFFYVYYLDLLSSKSTLACLV